MTDQENLRGITLMVVSMALFAVEDMFLKWAAADLPVGEIVFLSGAFGMVTFAVMARRQGAVLFGPMLWHRAVIARNIGEMLGTWGYITAIALVPLSTVSAVLQATPLTVTMAAALFMQAQVGWRRWFAIAVGFSGVLLVIRPGMEGFRPEALWVVLAVLGITLRDLATRAIPPECSTAQVSTWGLAAATLLGLLMMAAKGSVQGPTLSQSAVMLGALIFGTAGYWAITAASRTGEVSVVSPFRYVRLIFAMIIGALVFAERPDIPTLIGAGLIIASGLYAFTREQRQRRLARKQMPQ